MMESPEKFEPAEKLGNRLERGVDSECDECALHPDTVRSRRPLFFGMSMFADASPGFELDSGFFGGSRDSVDSTLSSL